MRILRILIPGTLLLILLSPLFLHAQSHEEEMMAQALQQFKSRNYYASSTWLERLLKGYPSTGRRREALLLLVKSYSLTQRMEKAEQYLRVLLKEYPDEATSLETEQQNQVVFRNFSGNVLPVTPHQKSVPIADKRLDVPLPQIASETQKTAKEAKEVQQQLPATPPKSATPEQFSGLRQENNAVQSPSRSPGSPIDPRQVPVPAPVALTAAFHPPIAPAVETNSYYSLSAGESVNRKKLDIVVEKLSEAGLQPVVAEVTREIDVFRLIVACFSDKKTAEQKRVQVAKRTRSAFMIKGGDSYCVIAGSLMSEGSAREEQSQLAAKGLEGLNIVKTRIRQKIWRVTVGRYSDMQEVEQSAQILLKRGLEVNIVKSGN